MKDAGVRFQEVDARLQDVIRTGDEEQQRLEEERRQQEELEQKMAEEEMNRLAQDARRAEEERLQKSVPFLSLQARLLTLQSAIQ